MKLNNLYSLIFAGLVLLLVLLAKIGQNHPDTSTLQEDMDQTAVNPGIARLDSFNYRVPINLPVNAPVILVKYLSSQTDILEKNSRQNWPLASITKLMTAATVIENMDLNQKITLNEKAVSQEGIAGNFRIGEIFTAADLLKATLVVSSNDATAALVNSFGENEFMEIMRKKTRELNMSQTVFVDATGLSHLNQSTAEDLTKLIRYIYFSHPEILKITAQKQVEITEGKSKIKRRLLNINEFAGRNDFLGGKTGFTDEAGGNLVSLFRYQNQPLVIIVFGAEKRFEETIKIYDYLRSN